MPRDVDFTQHLNAAGQGVLRLTPPQRDGTTHLVMSPLEFMQRRLYSLASSRVLSMHGFALGGLHPLADTMACCGSTAGPLTTTACGRMNEA